MALSSFPLRRLIPPRPSRACHWSLRTPANRSQQVNSSVYRKSKVYWTFESTMNSRDKVSLSDYNVEFGLSCWISPNSLTAGSESWVPVWQTNTSYSAMEVQTSSARWKNRNPRCIRTLTHGDARITQDSNKPYLHFMRGIPDTLRY